MFVAKSGGETHTTTVTETVALLSSTSQIFSTLSVFYKKDFPKYKIAEPETSSYREISVDYF